MVTADKLLELYAQGRRDFSGSDLRGVQLPVLKHERNKICLDDVNLSGSSLVGASLCGCSFVRADLQGVDLSGSELFDIDFSDANLTGATLSTYERPSLIGATFTRALLNSAQLVRANSRSSFQNATLDDSHLSNGFFMRNDFADASMRRAVLHSANLELANLTGACLNHASLKRANFKRAKLTNADLGGANLAGLNLYSAEIAGTKFSNASFERTILANVDLTAAHLNGATHRRSSVVGHDTLEITAAALMSNPAQSAEVEVFLKRCGVEEHMVEYFKTMVGQPLRYYAAFISYSHVDQHFARRLYGALQEHGIRCWLDAHDLKPGDRILDIVGEAIRWTDKVLLCCSSTSLRSWWVKDEVRKALERERREGRDLIIPIMLDRYLLDEWQDGLASEIRSRLAADMSGWRESEGVFEAGVARIVLALRREGISSVERGPTRR